MEEELDFSREIGYQSVISDANFWSAQRGCTKVATFQENTTNFE